MKHEILKEDEWLRFDLIDNKPKTKIISVYSKSSECYLGSIKWNPGWRNYCFYPTIIFETVFSDRCLLSISEFITELNFEHKQHLKEDKEDKEDIKTNKLPTNDMIKNLLKLK
jgi:hypothetical protein